MRDREVGFQHLLPGSSAETELWTQGVLPVLLHSHLWRASFSENTVITLELYNVEVLPGTRDPVRKIHSAGKGEPMLGPGQ